MARTRKGTRCDVVINRSLNTQFAGPAVVLDAVCRADDSGGRAWIFLKTGVQMDGITAEHPWKINVLRSIGGAPVIELQSEKATGKIALSVGGQALAVEPGAPETGLFSGLDVGLAMRNGEPVEIVLDWLNYHVRHHGMDAALIINRDPPEQAPVFLEALRDGAAGMTGLKRLLVLDSQVPLGREGLAPESHPVNAPDAPGKDRMDVPPPDPWSAPLGETSIYELVKTRFLSDARAVMNIDVVDILPATDGPSVFDRAVAARTGCIGLLGRNCYPWRVRKGQRPQFGDHICRPFDARNIRRRWCVAPGVAPGHCVWRLIRVVGTVPGDDEVLEFDRYTALRHPVESVSRIVPKTSLVEDRELLARAQDLFGHKPVRIPEQALMAGAETGRHTTIVTTMKNEGPFILEWLAHHRAIGVSDFLIYTNDCTDGTDSMLELLQAKGLVQHRDNPFRQHAGLKPQHAALQAADREDIVKASDWLICMDVDEFINIHVGDGQLTDLFDAVGPANMISLTWRLFGNSDIDEYRDVPVLEQFTRCAPQYIRKPHQAWGFKTLFRNQGIFKKLGVHRPKGLRPQLLDKIFWVNGSGRAMPEKAYRNSWRSTTETFGYDLVTLNHYAVRSAESFLVKRDRGRVNHVERDQGLSYWFRMNNNAEEDHSIRRMLPAMRAELEQLLADPDIRAAHEFSVRMHRKKIAELRARRDYADFYAELTSERMKKLSRLHSHFGANVFLAGPGVVPDEIVNRDPKDRFTFTVARSETTH